MLLQCRGHQDTEPEQPSWWEVSCYPGCHCPAVYEITNQTLGWLGQEAGWPPQDSWPCPSNAESPLQWVAFDECSHGTETPTFSVPITRWPSTHPSPDFPVTSSPILFQASKKNRSHCLLINVYLPFWPFLQLWWNFRSPEIWINSEPVSSNPAKSLSISLLLG